MAAMGPEGGNTIGKVSDKRDDQIARVDRVEDLCGAHDLEVHQRAAIGRLRRAAQHQVVEAELGARDLTVIRGGEAGGLLVMRLRVARAPSRFRGATTMRLTLWSA